VDPFWGCFATLQNEPVVATKSGHCAFLALSSISLGGSIEMVKKTGTIDSRVNQIMWNFLTNSSLMTNPKFVSQVVKKHKHKSICYKFF
jgi:uncharacterized ion transporter superfamily protein YfcC